jgi:hypothetical protein
MMRGRGRRYSRPAGCFPQRKATNAAFGQYFACGRDQGLAQVAMMITPAISGIGLDSV